MDASQTQEINPVIGTLMLIAAVPIIFLAQHFTGVLNKQGLWFGSTIVGAALGAWVIIYFTVLTNSFKRTILGGNLTAIGPLKAMAGTVVGAAIGGGAGFYYPVINILSFISFACSYMVMRGVTLLLSSRYPDEITVMNASMSETNNLLRLGLPCIVSLGCFFAGWGCIFYLKFQEVYGDKIGGYTPEDEQSETK